jgi:hypothetical protein
MRILASAYNNLVEPFILLSLTIEYNVAAETSTYTYVSLIIAHASGFEFSGAAACGTYYSWNFFSSN